MKCINCMARFCEQRCLARYVEDLNEQEEIRATNMWLCPCCKGIEPVGKYKGSDIQRDSINEGEKEKEEEEPVLHIPHTLPGNQVQIIESQVPLQTQTPIPKDVHITTVKLKEEAEPSNHEDPSPPATAATVTTADDDFCAVCGDIYSYDNNAIIFCDGCNVAVHQECYGVREIPDGEWLCDRCKSHTTPVCQLCSLKGGAMKQVVDSTSWVHLTCVATLYEVTPLELNAKVGPAGLLDKIDKRRYKLKCKSCKDNRRKDVTGPLIQCVSKKCTRAFHPICAQKRLVYNKELGIFVTFCGLHAPPGASAKKS